MVEAGFKPFFFTILLIFLTGCHTANPEVYSHIEIEDYGFDGEEEFCKDFKPELDAVKRYFKAANVISSEEFHQEYDYLPCFVRGTVEYKNNRCGFVIRAGGTAEIECENSQHQFLGLKKAF